MSGDDYQKFLLALVMWREARGSGLAGMRAVGHSIRNRVNKFAKTYSQIILQPWQYSSMTAFKSIKKVVEEREAMKAVPLPKDFIERHSNDLIGDSQLGVWPFDGDLHDFYQVILLANAIYDGSDNPDFVEGATHYFAASMIKGNGTGLPEWAKSMRFVKSVGGHDFYI